MGEQENSTYVHGVPGLLFWMHWQCHLWQTLPGSVWINAVLTGVLSSLHAHQWL